MSHFRWIAVEMASCCRRSVALTQSGAPFFFIATCCGGRRNYPAIYARISKSQFPRNWGHSLLRLFISLIIIVVFIIILIYCCCFCSLLAGFDDEDVGAAVARSDSPWCPSIVAERRRGSRTAAAVTRLQRRRKILHFGNGRV